MSKKYRTVEVRMTYEAGAAQYVEWPSGTTIHSGIGWFHPFGKSNYFAGIGYSEAEKFNAEELFSKFWLDEFDTNLFCVYRLPDGDIYAYDGIFAVRDEGDISMAYDDYDTVPPIRRDVLVNVIVGGTGAYEGAVGIMTGTAEGGGESHTVAEDRTLPDSIVKILSGYMRLPIKE
jgi:hypothetical protein